MKRGGGGEKESSEAEQLTGWVGEVRKEFVLAVSGLMSKVS